MHLEFSQKMRDQTAQAADTQAMIYGVENGKRERMEARGGGDRAMTEKVEKEGETLREARLRLLPWRPGRG